MWSNEDTIFISDHLDPFHPIWERSMSIITVIDICIHLTQSICDTRCAKLPFVKDLEHVLSINAGCWEKRVKHPDGRWPPALKNSMSWGLADCLSSSIKWKRYFCWRTWPSEDVSFVGGECDQMKTLFLLAITWILFTQFENDQCPSLQW